MGCDAGEKGGLAGPWIECGTLPYVGGALGCYWSHCKYRSKTSWLSQLPVIHSRHWLQKQYHLLLFERRHDHETQLVICKNCFEHASRRWSVLTASVVLTRHSTAGVLRTLRFLFKRRWSSFGFWIKYKVHTNHENWNHENRWIYRSVWRIG